MARKYGRPSDSPDARNARGALALIAGGLTALFAGTAAAVECPHNPAALGTARVLAIDPQSFPRIGTMQYAQSLPLDDKEVVLTFDDGPMPPYSNRVLDILAGQCVKANYFVIGRMARGYPEILARIKAEGHVIGTHSQNHPLAFDRMPLPAVQREIEQGIASVAAALGDSRALAPFFRIPGLLRARAVEDYLQSRGLVTFSADAAADDWKHLSPAEVVRRAMARLAEKGKGILLLHDIQPATAIALPELLRELKARGYRIVQVVPAESASSNPAAPGLTPQASAIAQPAAPAAAPSPAAAAAAAPAVVPQRPDPPTPPAIASADHVRDRADERSQAAPVPSDSAIPAKPVLPFSPGLKPPASLATPGKLIALEPGGWPRAVSVPVPTAGGVGVSPLFHTSPKPDGRFQADR